MAEGVVLEIATLPQRHPLIGDVLLGLCAAPVIYRLSVNPVSQPTDVDHREVRVDLISRIGSREVTQRTCVIGWNGLQGYSGDRCVRWSQTINERTMTEWAAIGVMALLIHELEGGALQKVLDIGSGGDYLVVPPNEDEPIQIEASGIREDATGADSRSRLVEKCEQVLKKASVGYASVTTFAHAHAPTPHSYLHYVERPKKPKGRKKGKSK